MAGSWAPQSPGPPTSGTSPAATTRSWTSGAAPIVTPEAVVLDFERAGVASRTLAITLDFLALIATVIVVGIVAALLGASPGGGGAGEVVLSVITSLLVVVLWFTAFETLWRGRTLGKAALGLRAVSADGTTVRFQQAFLRAAVGLVDFFLVPIGFVAVVSALLSPRDQRLGDMAAGTLVVRERSAQPFVAPAWFAPPYGYERYAASLDVGALDERTYGLIRTYLLRAASLRPEARDHLAVRLANPVALRMDHRPPPWLHPQLFLTCVAAAWQRAHGGPVPPLPPVQPAAQWAQPPAAPAAHWGAPPPPPAPRPAPPPPPPSPTA